MSKILEIAYWLIAATEVFAEYSDHTYLRYATKPLLMLVLIAFYRSSLATPPSRLNNMMMLALGFSWVGDVALMFTNFNENFFLVGLMGFLFAHILYIYLFRYTESSYSHIFPKNWWVVVPLLAYFAVLLYWLVPSIQSNPLHKPFLIPVLVYALTIGTMVVFALNRYGRVNASSFAWVFTGALLFMISDSIIAINKFVAPFDLAPVFIMVLYISGQYGIVKGKLKQ